MQKRVLGIDENGLGPAMGPLVVTGILLKHPADTDAWFGDIADSKSFFRARDEKNLAKIEETAISVFYLLEKKMPASPSCILNSFCRQADCISGARICTGGMPEKFMWAQPEGIKKRCGEFADWALKNRVEIERVRSVCACPNRINGFTEKDGTKLLMDFLAFCDIVEEIPDKNGLEVQAGKIGGLKFYKPYLSRGFRDYRADAVGEKEELSLYELSGKNSKFTMGFFMDVEKKSFPAALSSITGKYIRELFMAGIRTTLGIKENISGYHDRKTRQHIASIDFSKFPSACVLRSK